MTRAPSTFIMLGRSWTREILPMPMAPTLICLLGAICPRTDAGTIVGKPVMAATCREPFTNCLLEGLLLDLLFICRAPLTRLFYDLRCAICAFFCALMTNSAASRHWA